MWLGSPSPAGRRRQAGSSARARAPGGARARPARLQVADAGDRAGGDGRRQRGGEDEARRIGADGVAEVREGGDVAAHDAEALGQRAVDDVDAMHDAVALGEAAAARPVEADRMHLVEIGERAVCFARGRRWRRSGAIWPSIE